jgi:hypothetical protein
MNVLVTVELTPRGKRGAKDLGAIVEHGWIELIDGPPCLEGITP